MSHVPSEYQHADIMTKVLAFGVFAIYRRFLTNLSVWRVCFDFGVDRRCDVCMLISVYFCARVDASVMTQLGSYSKSRRISRIRGTTYVPIRSLVRWANCCLLTIRLD